jgi:hypothetical protein
MRPKRRLAKQDKDHLPIGICLADQPVGGTTYHA